MKKLTKSELIELRKIQEIIKEEKWKCELVKGNTAFVPNGQKWVETQEGIIKVLENTRDEFINFLCAGKGIIGKVSIDLEKGTIHEQPRDEKDSAVS